jgi:hypothetical protein
MNAVKVPISTLVKPQLLSSRLSAVSALLPWFSLLMNLTSSCWLLTPWMTEYISSEQRLAKCRLIA